MNIKQLKTTIDIYYLEKYEETKNEHLLHDILEFLKIEQAQEILDRILNKYNLKDYFINDFTILQNYLNIYFIIYCILFYFDEEELKKFIEKYIK